MVREHRLAVLRGPTRDSLADPDRSVEDLVGPLVARQDGNEETATLVDLEDRQRVVRDQLREGVGDPLQDRVEALLAEDVVKDVGEPAVRLHAPVCVCRR